MRYNFARHMYKIGVGFLDQGACSLANGNIDSTISATAGRYRDESKFWRFLSVIIDVVFFPFDGLNHCVQAYEKDKNEDFEQGILPLMLIFTLIGCAAVFPISIIKMLYNYVTTK